MKGFKEFLLRGNLVDLAVAVVIGTAFGTLVAATVKDIVTPLIAAVGGNPDFSQLVFTINGSKFSYGDFFNALLAFLTVAAVVYFLVLKPVALLQARLVPKPPVTPQRSCPECLSDIPEAARRCAFCTAQLAD